jgi:hypothetical protein
MTSTGLAALQQFYPDVETTTPELERVVSDAVEFFKFNARAPVVPSHGRSRGPAPKPTAPSHYNYLNAKAWYGKGGFYVSSASGLAQLNKMAVYFYSVGAPLFLVEKLGEKYKFFLDIDISVDEATRVEEIERVLLDENGGYRFLALLSTSLDKLFPPASKGSPSAASKVVLFSATGTGKVSWRVVFPNLIVDGKTASKARNALVEALALASFKESTTPWFRDLLASLKAINPENEWRNVLDESVLSGKFGIRQVLCDKLNANGQPEGRPMRPVVALKAQPTGLVADFTVKTPADLQSFLDLGCVRVPEAAVLCPFKGDDVKRSRMTRTGPGGSCVDVARFSEQITDRGVDRKKADSQFVLDLVFRGPVEALIEKLGTSHIGKWSRHDSNNASWTFENKMFIDFRFGRVTIKANTQTILDSLKRIAFRAGCASIGSDKSSTGSESPTSSNSTVGSFRKVEVVKSFYSQKFAIGKGQTGLEVLKVEGPQVLILKKGDGTQGWVPTGHLVLTQ